MRSPSRTAPGIGTWLVASLCLLLVLAAAVARAHDGTPDGEAQPAPEAADTEANGDKASDTKAQPAPEADTEANGDDEGEPEAIADEGMDSKANGDAAPDPEAIADGAPDPEADGDDEGEPEESADEAPDPKAATDEAPDPEADDAAASADEPCLQAPVTVARVHAGSRERRRLSLTHCDGRPHRDALDALSILARPRGVDRPSGEDRRAAPDDEHVAPNIRRLHPGLLTRLQALADRWPDKRIEIVSGYRPGARRTSRHHHARALDLRVAGIPRATVSRFARTLDKTGVGYYPNSVFTHIDVRHRNAYWVDRSGPGEAPDYGPWPRRREERAAIHERVLDRAFEALERLASNP